MSHSNPQVQETDSPPKKNNENIVVAAKGGGISFVGKLLNNGIGFVFSIIVARLLGAEQLGLYTLSLTIVGFVAAFALLGLNGGIARFIPIARQEKDTAKIWGVIQIGLGIPFLVSVLLMAIMYLTTETIAVQFFKSPALTPVLRLAIFAIPLFTLSKSFTQLSQAFKRVQYEVYALDITLNVVKLLLSVLFLSMGMGVIGVTSAYLISWIVSSALFFYFIEQMFSFRRPFNSAKRDFGEIFRFSIPLYLSRLLNSFSGSFETLALGFFGIIADVGVYSTILRLGNLGNIFFSSLRNISTPIIVELYNQKKYDELANFYQTTTKWAVMFNYPIFLTLILFATPLLSIFGSDFTVGAAGLLVLAGGMLFNAGTGMCGVVINMAGYSKVSFINSIIYLITTIILDILLIPSYQLMGAAWAGALTIIINNTLRMIEVYFLVNGLLPFNRTFFKPIIAGLLALSIIYPLTFLVAVDWPLMQLIILAPLLWISYAACVWLLKLSDEDRAILDKLLGRLKLSKK